MTKLNVILDLDQTLISAEELDNFDFKKYKKKIVQFDAKVMEDLYIVFGRPYLQEFLDYLFDNFNVSIWTAATKSYALFIIDNFIKIKPNRKIDFIFFSYHCDYSMKCKQGLKGLNVLWEKFGYDNDYVKKTFLNNNGNGTYTLKEEVNTQRKVEKHLAKWNADNFTNKIKYGLFDLISNVILFEVEGSNGEQFHFRFGIDSTLSFRYLDEHTRRQLDELYVNYFFRRQDNFWRQEAMQKLPALKRVTNMLVCGEDLGLVPDCVPDVMKQLGILSLEIQRMPKDNSKVFFHPNDAPYLSVVTPSTHDMSTIRGWWEEDKSRIQRFFNHELGQWGNAPYYCDAWINKAIVLQHLYSPAMWSVFQLQDILGIDDKIRRQNPNDERINVPANPKNYWRYRMHISLEDLIQSHDFNSTFSAMIKETGRG